MGTGYAPVAPGTVGTILGIPLYLALSLLSQPFHILAILALTGLAVGISQKAEALFRKKDSPHIVIDEIIGLQYTLLPAGQDVLLIFCGFLLFRFFDIVKVFPAGLVQDKLPGGYGIVADDVVAGIYGAVLLWLLAGFWR
ncbi:MAG: Phosphatidylglycerophosphatase A [Syntrophus sp. PtaU1.Bin208]|nr:MAG: Phosphatidylglycerophosphatase A [Syntrophus sp. PtaU1.Bin208]